MQRIEAINIKASKTQVKIWGMSNRQIQTSVWAAQFQIHASKSDCEGKHDAQQLYSEEDWHWRVKDPTNSRGRRDLGLREADTPGEGGAEERREEEHEEGADGEHEGEDAEEGEEVCGRE